MQALILLNLLGTVTASSQSASPTPSATPTRVFSIYEPYTFTTFAGNPPGSEIGTGKAARFDGPFGTAVDNAGNIYVADSNNNTIRKITPAGVVSTLAGLAGMEGSNDGQGAEARFFGPKGVAVDGAGNVYVADSGNHTIRKITPNGNVSPVAGAPGIRGCTNGTGGAARFNFPTGIAVDGNGNLYVADNVNNTIRKITAAGEVTTLAGAPPPAPPGSDEGLGTAAQFDGPFGIAVDSGGNLYVTDSRNHKIRKITPAGVVSTLAGSGKKGTTTDVCGTAAQFDAPLGVAVDSADNVYIADTFNQTIRKITSSGCVSDLAGVANEDPGGGGSADGIGPAAQFDKPSGIAVDSAGVLYVGDTHNNTIRKITPDRLVSTPAGVSGLGTMDGLGPAARFEHPNGLARDVAGNVYVADVVNCTIRKITPSGSVSTLAGSAGNPGYVNAKGTAAQFNFPRGVALDAGGNVYVSDRLNYVIRKITPDGTVSTLAGAPPPAPGATPAPPDFVNGLGSMARFNEPFGIAVDKSGNVFVADTTNNAIRKITPAGLVSTIATSAGILSTPAGLAIDSGGNLFVANSLKDITAGVVRDTILKVTQAGAVTTVAGSIRGSFDGMGEAARFNKPAGLALDGAGSIYVADSGNDTVRKIGTDGFVTTLGGLVGRRGGADGTGRATRFFNPIGVAVDSVDHLYVADNLNNTIRFGMAAPPVITSPPIASGTVDQEFTYQFTADGTDALTIGNLPPGLSPDLVHSAIVGTPTAAGTFSVSLSASNSVGTTKSSLTITIQAAATVDMNLVSGSGLTGLTGRLFNHQVKVSNVSSPATITATGLPPGLSIDQQTGLISGSLSNEVVTDQGTDVVTTAPVADGGSAVTLAVKDGSATLMSSTLQLTFTSDPALPVIISPTEANVTDGKSFSYAIATPTPNPSATPDPTAGTTTYAIAGTLPHGLTFDAATGTISGIFNQQTGQKSTTRAWKELNGGSLNVGSVQLFAKNKRGTATIPLLFLKAPPRADNLSTRVPVGTNDNVLIGGFIITGDAPSKVLVRGLGPSLNVNGVPVANALQDPTLELRDSQGALVFANDNWGSSCDAPEIFATDLAPTDDRESAILRTLDHGSYTTILRGTNNSTGVGLVEVFDLGIASLDVSSQSQLANISTRGTVQTGDAIMIGGFIIGGNTTSNVLVRALGPSLTGQGVAGALPDPVLELKDKDGVLVAANDDWTSDQEAEILFTNLAPANPRESAILRSLSPGSYSAIVLGKNGTSGVALVEVYVLP